MGDTTGPAADPGAEQVQELTRRVKDQARAFGFSDVGVARPNPTEHAAFYEGWIAAGHHGSMAYLGREDSRARRYDLTETLRPLRSVVVVAHDYWDEPPDPPSASGDHAMPNASGDQAMPNATGDHAIIARYARGSDYHDVIKPRLMRLLEWIRGEVGQEVAGRAYTDTGPILERDLAQRAGLGWFGRNTMLINPKRGSYFLLGVLLLDVELVPDEPFAADHCGTCTSCLTNCPTGALLGRDANGAPVIDARRCISYLTIENRGPIPRELRGAMGARVFGCDICQEVCPWNERFAGGRDPDPTYAPTHEPEQLALERLMAMDKPAWQQFSRRSPLRRPKRAGFLRNVAVALGNRGKITAMPVLTAALADPEPLVRGHAAWALGRLGSGGSTGSSDHVRGEVERALAKRSRVEADPWVRQELDAARAELA